MSKIINFRTEVDNTLDFIENFKEYIKEEGIDNLFLGSKTKSGDVLVGFTRNLDSGTTQEIISHAQTHLIMRMMRGDFNE